MAAPALLVAARRKFLDSAQYAELSAARKIGIRQILNAPAPWVTVGVGDNGLPPHYGDGQAAVSFHLRGSQWATSENSARFPKVGVTTWVAGPVGEHHAEWLAREVAECVIDVFDDPGGEAPPTWGANAYVIRCRWDGELSVSDVEELPTLWRADCAFNLELV